MDHSTHDSTSDHSTGHDSTSDHSTGHDSTVGHDAGHHDISQSLEDIIEEINKKNK